jgi:1A family penicillin-binding protein
VKENFKEKRHPVAEASKSKRSGRGRIMRILKFTLPAFIILAAALGAYCLHLSSQIDKRFSGRRWSVPSRVFSDTTLLYPGQKVDRAGLEKKLERLSYRKVDHKPESKGEMHLNGSAWELFLHDLEVPYSRRRGFPVKLVFKGSRIDSMVHLQTQRPLPLIELEPELLMLFFGPEREQRQLVSLKEVPPWVIHAILAAEDARFYKHRGVDPLGILRALYTDLIHLSIRQGGSTITQQLAKNYFLTPEKSLIRKFKELLLALTIEFKYDKDEILEIYLNEIYLGQMGSIAISGIGEAALFYFGKPVSQLTIDEGAVIAGLIRAPNIYSPYVDKNRSELRRNAVLQAMHQQRWISQDELNDALSRPLLPSGYENYERRAPYFVDYVAQQLSGLYPPEALTSLGLSIYTTLDTDVQAAAEKALRKGLKVLESRGQGKNKPEGAVLVMQPKTGYILAMVGGRDYRLSQFNRLTQSKRQPGSAFKPFVFLAGLDRLTPASLLSNQTKTYQMEGKPWRPHNYSPMADTRVTMRTALAKSINVATVDLAMKVGLDQVLKTAASFGFSTPLMPYPSLALGSFEVIPLELARAYCVFADDGMLPQPLSVKEVVDEGGNIVERRNMTVQQVTTPAKAFIINSMLRSAVEEGTGRPLRNMGIDFPLAGKTGTTSDFRDAWFVGYTPDLLALVWVGYDQGDSLPGASSEVALPIWADLANEIRDRFSGEWFKIPPGVVTAEICTESGQLAVPNGCPKTTREFFLEENAPKEPCPLHRGANPLDRIIKSVRDFLKSF